MASPSSNLDCETICVNHENQRHGGSIVERCDVAAEGQYAVERIHKSDVYDLNSCKYSTSGRFFSKCSFSCIWACLTTVLFLIVTVVGVTTIVQLSTEMDELKDQFTVRVRNLICIYLLYLSYQLIRESD